MIAFLRNFCASLAALIVFFIAVPFTFLVIIAAVIASIGEKDKLEVSKGGVLVLDLSQRALLIYALKYGRRRRTHL